MLPLSLMIQAASAGASTPPGGLKSITIADATPLDIASSIGPNGSGWVAICVLKGITSLVGTLDATKLTLTVSDPGYDTAGNSTTLSRTITGQVALRRQYPNGASRLISTDGTDLTIYVSLDDWIYSGTTIVSASLASGFYTGSVAGPAGTKINSSATAYQKPLIGWMNIQEERATGATHPVELVAFHRHARAGQQVACVKFNVTDGSNSSAEVTASTPTLSSLITQGNIPEVWAGTVDMTGMTQAAMCSVNAKVYPWIGDATAVLDLSSDGVAWPTSLPRTRLRVFCDRTGGYGGAYAYVKVGAAAGTVSATPATAAADPYPTLSAALTAVAAWNSANRAHNDIGGGIVRLMDDGSGGPSTHTINTATTTLSGSTYCDVVRDPATSAVVSVTWGSQRAMPQMTRWGGGLKIVTAPAILGLLGPNTAYSKIALDGATFDNTNNSAMVSWFAYKYIRNCTFEGSRTVEFNGTSTIASTNIPLLAGCVGTTTAYPINSIQGKVCVGNYLPKYQVRTEQLATGEGDHGRIVYNTRALCATMSNTTANTISYGVANVQNLYEEDGSVGVAMNVFADGDLTTITNYLEMHVTAVGNRVKGMYNDVVGAKVIPSGVPKLGVSKYSVWDDWNIKHDVFSTGAGSVGGWAHAYSVGNSGNVSLFGDVSRVATALPHNDNADGPYLGMHWLSSSEPNVFRTAYGLTQTQIMDNEFTSYTVAPRGVPALGGNYVPKVTSTYLKNRVPSGKSVLLRDLAGTLRRTDGTGAAGVYESA